MKATNNKFHIPLLMVIILLTNQSFSQVLVVDAITGSAQTSSFAEDNAWFHTQSQNTPFDDCNFPAVQAGLFGNDYGVNCNSTAILRGKTGPPFFNEHWVNSYSSSSAFVTGDNSQVLKIRWFTYAPVNSRTDDYHAFANADLNMNVEIALDQVPPATDVTVYYKYSTQVSAAPDHETDGWLVNEEDSMHAFTTLELDGMDLLPPQFDFSSPGGLVGFNSISDIQGSAVIQAGQSLTVDIISDLITYINPLGHSNGFAPFETDKEQTKYAGEITFSLVPFINIPDPVPSTEVLFSLDIGSDSEFGDPQQDGDENFDPGDVYLHNSLSSSIATYIDDATIFGGDPLPNVPGLQIPYHDPTMPMKAFGPIVFDLDGFETSDYNLHLLMDLVSFPMTITPTECTPQPDYFLVSFDDDTKENWSDPIASLPVESDSPIGAIYGETTNKDEVLVSYLGVYSSLTGSSHSEYELLNEALLHNALAPNPLSNMEDDDCDALAVERDLSGQSLCEFSYFSADHEGRHFDPMTGINLNPGSIYQLVSAGFISEVITPLMIGIPDGTDIDAFTFGAFPGDFNSTFALFFSVDEDDPQTPEDESGALDPKTIYYSILGGISWEWSAYPYQDDIDALSITDQTFVQPSVPCSDTYYYDFDGDGWGDNNTAINLCSPIPNYVSLPDDCDDTDIDVYPGAQGTGEGKDNNCNGIVEGNELACPGDFNGDTLRDTGDLLSLLGVMGCNSNCGPEDLNGDGSVNSADLLLFLALFGTPCP